MGHFWTSEEGLADQPSKPDLAAQTLTTSITASVVQKVEQDAPHPHTCVSQIWRLYTPRARQRRCGIRRSPDLRPRVLLRLRIMRIIIHAPKAASPASFESTPWSQRHDHMRTWFLLRSLWLTDRPSKFALSFVHVPLKMTWLSYIEMHGLKLIQREELLEGNGYVTMAQNARFRGFFGGMPRHPDRLATAALAGEKPGLACASFPSPLASFRNVGILRPRGVAAGDRWREGGC